MAIVYPVGGGAPGINPADLTATAGDVVAGAIAGVKDNYDPVVGTLTLTGNAQTNHVLSGETFYTTNPKSKITGTMTVQSILSFSCAPYSFNQIVFTWQNPQNGPFSGVIIVGKTGGYPANINDGTRYYKGFGNNVNSLGYSSIVLSGFSNGITYYFRVFGFSTINGEEWISNNSIISNVIINTITQTFADSTTWTVPSNVNSVTVFLVGGGGGGSAGRQMGGSGGGGGKTKTDTVSVTPGSTIPIIIGSGGSGVAPAGGEFNGNIGGFGGTTYFGELLNAGGGESEFGENNSGGNGGSGGGGAGKWGAISDGWGGNGGSNGSNGEDSNYQVGGTGQHSTTRAFGEPTGTLYAGGGGGAARGFGGGTGGSISGGNGGSGGGGAGGDHNGSIYKGVDGSPNTGGGGGGNGSSTTESGNTNFAFSGSGGKGICIIRYAG